MTTPEGRVIAAGYNGSPSGQPHCNEVGCDYDTDGHCIRSVHAEENAILQCAKLGHSSQNAIMYITHSPCSKCSKRIIQAGISKVVYLQEYQNSSRIIGEEFFKSGIEFERMLMREADVMRELIQEIRYSV